MLKPDLRLAIISDIHLGFLAHGCPNYYGHGQIGDQGLWLEYVLRYFKNKGVDAIVVPGDMANGWPYGKVGVTSEDLADTSAKEMAQFANIFHKVFDGTETQLVTIYGNHDNQCQPRERLNGGDSSPWEEAFGEPYTHINVREVNGYRFIGANWGYEKEARPFIEDAVTATPDKPVFYIQHGEIKGTTCDTLAPNVSSVGIDNIRDFENVIGLFGHTHCPITDERTIWQSAKDGDPKCTVISCSTLNYGDSNGDLIKGENLKTKHALYLTVAGKEINVERLNFWTDEMVSLAKGEKSKQDFTKCTKSAGKDWHFTLFGKHVLDQELRASTAKAPEFPENAIAGAGRADTYVMIYFPAAIPLDVDDDMIHSYYAEAYEEASGELVSSGVIATEHHIDHTHDHYSEYYQILIPNLKPDTKYIFKVYARDCYQKLSERPLIHKDKTMPFYKGRLV